MSHRMTRHVERRSWRVDAAILLRTADVVTGRAGISAPGHATVPEFTGTPR